MKAVYLAWVPIRGYESVEAERVEVFAGNAPGLGLRVARLCVATLGRSGRLTAVAAGRVAVACVAPIFLFLFVVARFPRLSVGKIFFR